MDGYAPSWRNQQALSVTTWLSSTGQRDLYLNALGVNTHLHTYVPAALSGTTLGYSLKDRGIHLGSPQAVRQDCAVPFARLEVSARPGGAHVAHLEVVGSETHVSQPFSARTTSGTPRSTIQLPFEDAPGITVELYFVSSDYSPLAGDQRLTWGDAEPWAIICRTVPRVAGEEGE